MLENSQIISISRRTDIPAWYSKWLKRRFADGYVEYSNPFTGRKYGLGLKPEDVAGIVFWSRDFRPSYRLIDELKTKGYPMIFHFTLTPYEKPFEEYGLPFEISLEQIKHLSNTFSPEHVVWRYDPIILSSVTDSRWHVERFSSIASALKPYTRRCHFSFIQIYRKVDINFCRILPRYKIKLFEPSIDERVALAQELEKIALESNIRMLACCQPELVEKGIAKASCVDTKLLQSLYPERIIKAKLNPLRKGCGCHDSRDIGAYDTCPNGCLYCYATESVYNAQKFHSRFKPSKQILG